jgi:hypothetical protein
LHHPSTTGQSIVLTVAWIALALAGHAVQERLTRRGEEV